jgi:2-amino-4-hydroxy-6-hydroxymethyldihydropteridine diphosphokinase
MTVAPEAGLPSARHEGSWATAYIGLGSNLCAPEVQVASALQALRALPGCQLSAASGLYVTAPVGPIDQPDYVNAVAALQTRLEPLALLEALQALERHHGRVRDGTRWGPRILDLDILLYCDLTLDLPGLAIPHPEMTRRAFVLVPLAEIAPPGLAIPGLGSLSRLLGDCPGRDGVRPLIHRSAAPGEAIAEALS